MAFTNPGGIRTDIAMKDDGAVSYADVFAAQPFRNKLVTLTLTGAQIKDAAGAAMARPDAAAHPAGLAGVLLRMGRSQALRRACRRRRR